MRKFEIDEDILETMLEAAYRRGHQWGIENIGDPFKLDYLWKAARDYADKTITEAFGPND